jgi:branched-subunit amino acid transport protein AzlD
MYLTTLQTIVIIFAVALGTMVTRFTPFIMFPDGKERPAIIDYLARMLPASMMGLLVVYCLKDVSVFVYPNGISELLAIIVIVLLHLWKRNVLLSIGAGTLLYMFFVQVIFI